MTNKEKVMVARVIKKLEKSLPDLNSYLTDNPPKYYKSKKLINFGDYLTWLIDNLYALKLNYIALESEQNKKIIEAIFMDSNMA